MEITDPYSKYVNPGFQEAISLLGTDAIHPTKASGSIIMDANRSDEKFFDFTAGLAVAGLGHNHPDILHARAQFLASGEPLASTRIGSLAAGDLEREIQRTTNSEYQLGPIADSGAHAVELAVICGNKLQDGDEPPAILYCDDSYHGKTILCLNISGQESTVAENMPAMENTYAFQFNSISSLREKFVEISQKHKNIIVVMEPVIADSVDIPSKEFCLEMQALCKKYQAVLICDEVFVGLWRCGKFFAHKSFGLSPDLVAISKSFGGAKASIGAVLVREDRMSTKLRDDFATVWNLELRTSIAAMHAYATNNAEKEMGDFQNYMESTIAQIKESEGNFIFSHRGIGGIHRLLVSPLIGFILRFPILPPPIRQILCKIATGFTMAWLVKRHKILTLPCNRDSPGIIVNAQAFTSPEDKEKLQLALIELSRMNIFALAFSFIGSRIWKK